MYAWEFITNRGSALDTSAPVWPDDSKLTVSEITPNSLKLSWTRAEDNVGVTEYEIYCNDDSQPLVKVDGNTLSYVISNLNPGTEYQFYIKACNEAGNWSDNSPLVLATTLTTSGGSGGGGGGCLSQLAAGASHTLVVNNGEVWTTGINSYGQLGDGTNENRVAPVKVHDLDGIVAVAAGSEHSMTLQEGGTVWTWGRNRGQLGDGTTTNSNIPVQVKDLTDIVAIAAGSEHSIALKSDGSVWTWGRNRNCQLGNGTTTDSNIPVKVTDLTDIVAIAAGSEHSIALKSDGSVWTWGRNNRGQLGNGTTANSNTPVEVTGISGIIQIYSGKEHNIAIKNDGTIWGWGNNGKGQLGDGTTTSQPSPVKIETLNQVVSISAGANHTLALKEDGTLLAWGDNYYGQLGDSTNTASTSPIAVKDIDGIMEITAGDNHCIALKDDNTMWAWGRNNNGQLGIGTATDSNTPIWTYKALSPLMLVVATNPAKDAQNVSIDANIEITFSKNVDSATIQDRLILTNAEDSNTPVEATITCEKNKLVIAPKQKLNYDTGYMVTIKQGIAEEGDSSNTLESEETWNFTTERLILITYPYALASGEPTGGIYLDDNTFRVNFFKKIDPTSFEQQNAIVLNKIGTLGNPKGEQISVPFTYELVENSLEITSNEILEYGTYYELIIPAGIRDSEKNATVKDTKVVFYTVSMTSEYQITQDGKPVTAVKPDQTYDLVATITNKSDKTEEATVILQVRGGKGASEEYGGYVVGLPQRTEITVESGASVDVSMTFYTDPEVIEPAWKDDIYGDIMVLDKDIISCPKAVTGHFTFPIDNSGLTCPILQAHPDAIVGQDVVITFLDDPTWRSSLLTFSVTVDGETLETGQYKVTEGKITINAEVFREAKDYLIVIEALGYEDTSVTQTVSSTVTAPVLKMAEVTTSKDISLTFDKEIADPSQTNIQFTVSLDGVNALVKSVEKVKQPGKIKLTIEPKTTDATKEIVIIYTKNDDPTKQLKSTDGTVVESFISKIIVVNDKNQDIPITDGNQATTIKVSQDVSDATLNVSSLLQAPSNGKVTTQELPEIKIEAPTSLNNTTPVKVEIPQGAIINAPIDWAGTINVPKVVSEEQVKIEPDSGKKVNKVTAVIEVGAENTMLTFTKAVKLVIPGQAGMDAGFYCNGVFKPITTPCKENSQAWADENLPAGGDGKIDEGNDLVIWTKHFTKFVTYEQTATSGGGNSGGNNGSGDGTGGGEGSGTPGGLKILSFNKVKLSPTDTLLQFDFGNGMDRTLSNNLNQIHVYEKATKTEVKWSNHNYIKEGSGDDAVKIRRLELMFNNLKSGTTYVVELGAGVEANNGGTLGTKQTFEFTTTGTSSETGGAGQVIERGIAKEGGTITEHGTRIEIPAAAFDQDIKVTVQIIAEISKLPMAEKSKLASDVMEITKDKDGNFNKPVTITITFDKSKVDTNKYDLSICYLDEKDNKWIPLDNVKVDLSAGKVSGETKHFTKFVVIATEKAEAKKEEPVPIGPGKVVNLNDIKGHWAEKTIAELVASGAIAGYPDGTFKPDQGISRAEFATIVVKAFQLPEKKGKVFEDTANHWAQDFIATAAANGIVSGYSDTTFGPGDSITREQMAVMIAKAAKLAEAQEGKTFADGNKVSAWAKNAVVTASEKNIISGYPDNTFRPQNNATRAEAATVIIKSLKLASQKNGIVKSL